MTKPSETDLEKALKILGDHSCLCGLDVAQNLALALANERVSLPESVNWYILNRCPSFIVETYMRWQKGEGPEPRKDGENE